MLWLTRMKVKNMKAMNTDLTLPVRRSQACLYSTGFLIGSRPCQLSTCLIVSSLEVQKRIETRSITKNTAKIITQQKPRRWIELRSLKAITVNASNTIPTIMKIQLKILAPSLIKRKMSAATRPKEVKKIRKLKMQKNIYMH